MLCNRLGCIFHMHANCEVWTDIDHKFPLINQLDRAGNKERGNNQTDRQKAEINGVKKKETRRRVGGDHLSLCSLQNRIVFGYVSAGEIFPPHPLHPDTSKVINEYHVCNVPVKCMCVHDRVSQCVQRSKVTSFPELYLWERQGHL